MVLNKAETAVRKAGKKLKKAEKKQIETDCSDLRKLLTKAKPEKITADDLYSIHSANAEFTDEMANELYECARLSADLDNRMDALRKSVKIEAAYERNYNTQDRLPAERFVPSAH